MPPHQEVRCGLRGLQVEGGLTCNPWGRLWSPSLWRLLSFFFFFSCYASKKMAAFELCSSYRNGWSSFTLWPGCQHLTGLSWWADIIRGCRTQDTYWHVCWHRVHKQGSVEVNVCGRVCFLGAILIGSARKVTDIKKPVSSRGLMGLDWWELPFHVLDFRLCEQNKTFTSLVSLESSWIRRNNLWQMSWILWDSSKKKSIDHW